MFPLDILKSCPKYRLLVLSQQKIANVSACLLSHPQVVVQLTDDLLSQAVMMVEDSRPTLAINLSGARQYWLEGMLRHEIGQWGNGGTMGRAGRMPSILSGHRRGDVGIAGRMDTVGLRFLRLTKLSPADHACCCLLRHPLHPWGEQHPPALAQLGGPQAVQPEACQPHRGRFGQPAQCPLPQAALPLACSLALLHH